MPDESAPGLDKHHDWFDAISARRVLPESAIQELRDTGFIIIPGPVPPDGMLRLSDAYDSAVACADAEDAGIGSTTLRVNDFVNRGPEFDELYIFPPLLEACCRIIEQPFRLSTMLSRTLLPGASSQNLHADFERDAAGWPMIGFILMIDEFRGVNGATHFAPGSHRRISADEQVPACGPAGSIIIYNGSILHGHGANLSGEPRRSIQGAFIRRERQSGIDLPARMLPDTLARIGPVAKYVLAV
jgi:Phytanoyl-CoA dioxygenase (PhyH)